VHGQLTASHVVISKRESEQKTTYRAQYGLRNRVDRQNDNGNDGQQKEARMSCNKLSRDNGNIQQSSVG
jgi:hypothetical protein